MKPFIFLWVTFALFTKWAFANDLPFSYGIQVENIEFCGKYFSKISASTNISNLKSGTSQFNIEEGANRGHIFLPDGVQATDFNIATSTARGTVQPKQRSSVISLQNPVMPDIPLFSDEYEGAQPLPHPKKISRVCEYIERYVQSYPYLRAQYETSFVKLSISGGRATLSLKQVTPVLQIKKTINVASAQGALPESAAAPAAAAPTGYQHLIIYDPLYETEANRLKGYRNLFHKHVSYAISVESLPGYNSKDPIPIECQGSRYEECYFDPSIASIEGVSKEAVPALYGYRNDIIAGEPYSRVSYIPGIIRAYIREFKKTNPLKYIVFMGDPRFTPNFYSNYIDYFDPTGTHSSDIYYPAPARWYMSENAHLTQNSDFWFANPDLALTPLHRVNRNDRTYFLWPCISGNGTKTYRPDCLSNETIDSSFYNGDTSQLGWSIVYPLSTMIQDFNTAPELFERNLDDIITVGRINSEHYLDLTARVPLSDRKKDPGVNTYISKLILWESKDIKLANGTYPITAHQLWSWDQEAFHAQNMMKSLFGLTDVPFFYSANGDETSTAFNFLGTSPEKYAWYIHGHGGHAGVQGPSQNFSVPNSFRYDHGAPSTTSQVQNVQLFTPGQNGTFYAGFIHANSCDVSSYRQGNAHLLNDAASIGATTLSMGEHLTTGSALGAGAATHMNYNVGWSNSEAAWNQPFDTTLKTSSALCEPFGRTIARMQQNSTSNSQGQGTLTSITRYPIKNKVYMGDPLARQSPKNCALPVGPVNTNNAFR